MGRVSICRRQRGFTLLEVLITLVIVSIGLLGILGLQTVSIANTQASSARTLAARAVDNMADRMRANFPGARTGDYDGVDHPSAGAEPAACTLGNTCSFAAMAARDAWEWDARIDNSLSGGLPGGEGHIACAETVGGECVSYTVSVLWRERDPDRSAGATDPDISQCDNDDPMGNGCFQTRVRP